MPRRYPILNLREVLDIFHKLGFKEKNSVGSHHKYAATREAGTVEVTVDHAVDDFEAFLLKSMIKQAGSTRKQFYGATKRTAKKIGIKFRR